MISQVLIISGATGTAAERYRCVHLQEQFAVYGIPCHLVRYDYRKLQIPNEFAEAGLAVIHRAAWDANLDAFITRSKKRGGLTIFDIDDLVFEEKFVKDLPVLQTMHQRERKTYFDGVYRYQKTLTHCDLGLSPTEFLCAKIREQGVTSFVHRNALGVQELAISENAYYRAPLGSDGQIRIGYFSGSNTHDADFLECADALLEIMEQHPQVRLLIAGTLNLDSRFERFQNRVDRVSTVGWEELPFIIRRSDINLAPLQIGIPYCEAKSELKYFEAGILGVPTIASATGSYCHAIMHGTTGYLAASPMEWIEALRRLITQPHLRQEIGCAAQRDAYRRYSPMTAAKSLLSTLEEISATFPFRNSNEHVSAN